MSPTPGGHPGVAWVSLTAQAHLHYQAALPHTGTYLGVGPRQVGSQGLPHSLGPIHGVIGVTRQQVTVIPLHGLGQAYCFCGTTRVIRW